MRRRRGTRTKPPGRPTPPDSDSPRYRISAHPRANPKRSPPAQGWRGDTQPQGQARRPYWRIYGRKTRPWALGAARDGAIDRWGGDSQSVALVRILARHGRRCAVDGGRWWWVVGVGGGSARTGVSSLVVVRRGGGVCRRRLLGGRMLVVRIEVVCCAWVRMRMRGQLLQRPGRRARKRHVLRRPRKPGRSAIATRKLECSTAADPQSRVFPPQSSGSSRALGPQLTTPGRCRTSITHARPV